MKAINHLGGVMTSWLNSTLFIAFQVLLVGASAHLRIN